MNQMTRDPRHAPAQPGCRGEALAATLHVLLLMVVLGQLVYLGSRYRVRFDATGDKLWSLTDSTRDIVGGLDKRLIVEAYFSPKEDLPARVRDTRIVLENFLDELVQLGRGKVAVQRFNPLDDKAVQDKCTRIGVKPIDIQQQSTTGVSVQQHWQGLRLIYGTGKDKVIEQIAPTSSFLAEAILTPAIKEVATKERKKIGFMEWPSAPPGGQGQPMGWNYLRTVKDIARRYLFQSVQDAEGVLVPDDIDTLMLFRPKDLTDRQKYVVDQFLMRGGTLVLFADVAEYALQPRRQCNKLPLELDSKDSQWKWKDQLWNYGIDLPGQIVADLAQQSTRVQNPLGGGHEYFGVPTQMGLVSQVPYPYFFHAFDGDWAEAADQLARIGGREDAEQAEYFRKTLRPGIDTDEFLFKAFKQVKRGPGFYWPCVLDLRRKATEADLPTGVDGRALLWSSPLTVVEDPPASLNPLTGADLQAQLNSNRTFMQKLNQRLASEPRRQVPLMIDLRGRFPSFFAGKDRPKRPAEIKEEEARKAAEAEAQAKGEDAAGGEAGDEPVVGPPMPDELKADDKNNDKPEIVEPDPLAAPVADSRIVAIADSDFVRDDLVQGHYRQMGGPQSIYGGTFFMMLLDWLSQDSDLVALQSRIPTDRKIELVESTVDRIEDRRDAEMMLRQKKSTLVRLNIVVPCALLLALGAVVFLVRRSQKRRFLEAVGN